MSENNIKNICLKYKDKIMAYPTVDGFKMHIYAENLLDKNTAEDFFWNAYTQNGLGALLDGWKFIIEVHGKKFLEDLIYEAYGAPQDLELFIETHISEEY